MSLNPLKQLESLGQSIWLDAIDRKLIEQGKIVQLIQTDGLAGITSNPTIFEKAIGNSKDYDEQIKHLLQAGNSINDIFEKLSQRDIQDAADLFRNLYETSDGKDGYVSLEVNPHLAHDNEGTVAEARRLWKAVNRPNILIKIPGTREGLLALTQLIEEGINVNVTLLFSVTRYQEVLEAFAKGLEARIANKQPLRHIASVASFFLSRIDTLIDPLLENIAKSNKNYSALAHRLQGEVAIASARLAYDWYKKQLTSERFKGLLAKGAVIQRLLWASTSTKNPNYSPVKYIEALILKDTVNTLPMETLDSYRNNGNPKPMLESEFDKAKQIFEDLSQLGLSMDALTQQLEMEGLDKFNQSFDGLQQALQRKVEQDK